MNYLVHGVPVPHVVTTGELVDVSVQVLFAYPMEGTHMRPPEEAPEALHAVSVNGTSDVLHETMPDRLVILKRAVGRRIVRVDLSAFLRVLLREALQRLRRGILSDLGADPLRGTVLDGHEEKEIGSIPTTPANM